MKDISKLKLTLMIILAVVFVCPNLEAKPKKPKKGKKMGRWYLQHSSTATGGVSWSSCDELNPDDGDFTIMCWVKTEQDSSVQTKVILYKAEAFGTNGWAIHNYTGKAYVLLTTIGAITENITGTTTINDGEWHHIVVTRDCSESLLSLYVDNNLEGTTESTKDISNTSDLTTYITASSASTGAIDEIRFYKGVALSANSISNIYNDGIGVRVKEKGFKCFTSNGFYASCDDGSGTTVSGRKISSGTWSDHNGSFASGDLTWKEGGIPLHSVQLTSDWTEHTFYINRTSKAIQFQFTGREAFQLKAFKILSPQVLGNR